MLHLKLWNESTLERDVSLEPDCTCDVGRSSSAGIRVNDIKVSRRHCRLLFSGGSWLVEDLGSTNGTFLNDARIQQAAIRAGDRIAVGSHVLEVVEGAAPMPAPPDRPIRCTGCGKSMPPDALSTGKAVLVNGKTLCLACGVEAGHNSGATDDSGNKLFSLLRDFQDPEPPRNPGTT